MWARLCASQGRCDVNIRNNRGQTPLQLAVTQGHMQLVELLVMEGANVNAEDEEGDTAMHTALSRQQLTTTLSITERDASNLYSRVRACETHSVYMINTWFLHSLQEENFLNRTKCHSRVKDLAEGPKCDSSGFELDNDNTL